MTERIPQTIAGNIIAAGMVPWMLLLVAGCPDYSSIELSGRALSNTRYPPGA